MSDRIDRNEDGTIDDVVLDATSVHIEDLGDRIWIAVNRADGDRFTFEVDALSPTILAKCRMVESAVGSMEEQR